MKKNILIHLLIFLSILTAHAQIGEKVYNKYCAGCHGANLQGTTSASPLIKMEWKHGFEKKEISQTIRKGVSGSTMIAWESVLKETEISALADFIIQSQKNTEIKADTSKIEFINSTYYRLKIEKFFTPGLTTPWGIEFVDTNRALISGKKQGFRWFVNGQMDSKPIEGLPPAFILNETSGYLDLALDPDYKNNGWVYLSICHTNGDFSDKKALSLTKIIRGKIVDYQWVNNETLFEVSDSLMVVNGSRWGCRLLFDKTGQLYFTIGEMVKSMDSQDLGKPTGKVFRINSDGSIPKDYPFSGNKTALPALFSIGNRNVQGIAQHPATGDIWATEHGPKGGDELNILKAGNNYGWPVITYGINYNGTSITDKTHEEGMEQPVLYWTPSIAASAIDFSTSPLFPKWKNNLLIGSLAFQELRRVVIENDHVIHQEILLKDMGRVRDVKFGPDGALYLLMNDQDAVFRIVPETE
jgi:aldose sugar dehydrogenase